MLEVLGRKGIIHEFIVDEDLRMKSIMLLGNANVFQRVCVLLDVRHLEWSVAHAA